MATQKITSNLTTLGLTVALVLAPVLTLVAVKPESPQASVTAGAPPEIRMADAQTLAPVPPYLADPQAPAEPAALSTTPSYYFISGNTFTPGAGLFAYFRQADGCVNQMPLNNTFAAPVHLPQASQVVSITLYTNDTAITTTISTAYFILNNGQGGGGYTLSASSRPNTLGYQQNTSTQNNPATIDNQNYNYYVQWNKTGFPYDSPYLSLCGVRVTYYAPLGPAAYLPHISK